MLQFALLTGGPSRERGISLNSARSFLDHTEGLSLEVEIFYLAPSGLFYPLQRGQVYSNTPADFDFKIVLQRGMQPLELCQHLQSKVLVVSLIHGAYGEDGTVQALLEEHQIPYFGSSSAACRRLFHKGEAKRFLQQHHFATLPGYWIDTATPSCDAFWHAHCARGAILKPTLSGSSLGVRYVDTLDRLPSLLISLREEGFHEFLLEPYCSGREFTLPLIEERPGVPRALPPIEIDLGGKWGDVFDYRRKYLPTDQTRHFCPPRVSVSLLERIQQEGERFFAVAELSDAARIDGWIVEDEIYFSDINPLSGMEQNSVLFQSAAHAGFSHRALLRHLLENALARRGPPQTIGEVSLPAVRRPVYILTGGGTAERQVALMSGTNVWLKLLSSELYVPRLFLLDKEETVWPLSYARALHHTVEEILFHLQTSADRNMSLETFFASVKQEGAFLFLALHGGIGEDGTLQRKLEQEGIAFNGSGAEASRLCMDKERTARILAALNDPTILSMPQYSLQASSFRGATLEQIAILWHTAAAALHTEDLLIKPQCDGCSAGIVRLRSLRELACYLRCVDESLPSLPPGTFSEQDQILEMSRNGTGGFLLEPYIHTDRIQLIGGELIHTTVSGWIEVTIGLWEVDGEIKAFNPSVTVASGGVLSLEEKFQGGTGVNLTPPPEKLLPCEICAKVKRRAVRVAKVLGITNYARLDLFVELRTGVIRVIEANTLPALTPSTVLYHQAWSETPPLSPRQFLEKLIERNFQLE